MKLNLKSICASVVFAAAASAVVAAGEYPLAPSTWVNYPEPSLITKGKDWGYRRFDRKIVYKTQNGGAIKIYAQNQVTDEQMLRAYNWLDFFLTDVPDAKFGKDKAKIANYMADQGAVLVMPNGRDGQHGMMGDMTLNGQPLYELEFPTEGSKHYITNDYEYRDAGPEEIFHMVHDNGIGTKYTDGFLKKSFRLHIKEAKDNAMVQSIWPTKKSLPTTQDWITELAAEGSLEQEYIVSVLDSYYGYWQAFDEEAGGMWGIYAAKNRAEVKELDPQGYALMQAYFPPYITYMARIDPSFSGVFSLQLDAAVPYTFKSQYLLNARLLGDKNSNLLGNAQDNVLIGNAGDNMIDGGAGFDIVQIYGNRDEYQITHKSAKTYVIKSLRTAEKDTLKNIERLRFQDTDVIIN